MPSQGELLSKVRHFKEKSKSQSAEIKKMRKKIVELEKSRALKSEKLKIAVLKLKANSASSKSCKAVKMGIVPNNYHFPIGLIQLCVLLRIQGGCSFRGVVRVLEIMQKYGLNFPLPCANSIENWVQKLGCFALSKPEKENEKEGEKCLIIDESIGIGQERMLCILAAPSEQKQAVALSLNRVKVALACSQKSWKGEEIAKKLKALGTSVQYVVSDGGKNLKKGITDAGLIRVPDASHELGKCLEKTFAKDADFVAFGKTLKYWQTSGVHTEFAYLLPPKQRTVARFMNLYKVIAWADKLQTQLPKLCEKTRTFFANLSLHHPLIQSLTACLEFSKTILTILKTNGLNLKTLRLCKAFLRRKKKQQSGSEPNTKVALFLKHLQGYLEQLDEIVQSQPQLKANTTAWYCCSDVIESFFGKYKSLLATNPLCGISPLCLEMPLHTRQGKTILEQPAMITALEAVSHSKLTTWIATYLLENKAFKRKKILNKKNE